MIGASGPSISMVALSTPMPRSAASTCSTVDTSGPSASPSTVWNSVAITERAVACTSRSPPGRPVRTKIRPASTDAGPIVRLTGEPECTPTPVTVACERSVVCRLNFIADCPLPLPNAEPTHLSEPHRFSLQVSPSRGKHKLCLKQRQLTVLYRLLPHLCRIGAQG